MYLITVYLPYSCTWLYVRTGTQLHSTGSGFSERVVSTVVVELLRVAEAPAGSVAEENQQASQEKPGSNPAIGFIQLYPALCSVDLVPYYVLYDLFVLPAARKHGVATALMNAAADFARENGAARLDLETAHTNQTAKSLYLKLGYEADTTFQKYSLELT